MEIDPFSDIVISSFDILDETVHRQPCSQCCKSRKYFCYSCLIPLPSLINKIPCVHVSNINVLSAYYVEDTCR